MAVSFRAVGTWAELTADGAVAIPATPQAGDRMYLFARWKDFSITAQVTSPVTWDEITEFADGSATSGNGTGSVKVACWYRDWQPGDTNPTVDFSASPTNASVVIIVMAKDADDVWSTPVARTAAMTNWTTTSQIVSASASVAVPSSGVVMGLIGIRDDTATMTRPTTGIDDSTGAITWNGNYVEAPATHHSTTTGDDGAADLGYRLVTTGATATLRMTGTISAAETGAALWVVQGVSTLVTPATAALTNNWFASSLEFALTPASNPISSSTHVPRLLSTTTPAGTALSTTTFAPGLHLQITPPVSTLTATPFTPRLAQFLTPVSAALNLTAFTASSRATLIPGGVSLSLDVFTATILTSILITPANTGLVITTTRPHVLPFRITWLDPGGDATQAVGHFNADANTTGLISFDGTQQVQNAGSYKFDSDTGVEVPAAVNGILDNTRRVSAYFRYDSVPDALVEISQFVSGGVVYSGGGFASSGGGSGTPFLGEDDGLYGEATPAKNAGQGSLLSFPLLNVPVGAVIDSVKISYERKYDVNTSIGISRVRWEVDEEEGPNHDNAAMPLTDTVVEVDVTGDRAWEWQHFQGSSFKVIAEARRGDTDTAHTQRWDYVKVVIVYHQPAAIMAGLTVGNLTVFRVAIRPVDSWAVLRFVDGAGDSYDGITRLLVNTAYRISFAYSYHGVDDLDINLFVNGIPELSITGAATGGLSKPVNLHYGWLLSPGADHLCWFSHLYIDDGDDLLDPGNMLSTAKLSAAVNENNWDTTGGTGAVNERPLSETNYIMQSAFSSVRQTYTLQSAAAGDRDVSGESLIGYMGWAWAKRESGSVERIGLIVNNVDVSRSSIITTSPSLLKLPVTSTSYPSHAAGIGMSSNSEDAGVFMYECGAVVAYEGPLHSDILLERQQLDTETLPTIIDDLRADPPDSYEVCCQFDDFDGTVEIVIHSLDQDNGSLQFQGTLNSNGRVRITPGVEVQLDVTVVGMTSLQIWRRTNFD